MSQSSAKFIQEWASPEFDENVPAGGRTVSEMLMLVPTGAENRWGPRLFPFLSDYLVFFRAVGSARMVTSFLVGLCRYHVGNSNERTANQTNNIPRDRAEGLGTTNSLHSH
jgi:hypothetical protein